MTPDRRRLLYRSMHRGFKEADLLIGNFAKDHLETLTDEEVEEFATLLEVPDQVLYSWLIGTGDVPAEYDGPVFRKLKAFDVSAIVMSGRF